MNTPTPDVARKVFVEGFAPHLSSDALSALKTACDTDDDRLRQGSTTTPPPLMCVQDWPCEGACALGFCGWQGDGLTTVGEVEEFFAVACFRADELLGELAACRRFLNWYDETPRPEMRSLLSIWCGQVLSERSHPLPPIVVPQPECVTDPFA